MSTALDGQGHVRYLCALDGFITGPNVRVGNGMGDGGDRLHDWRFAAKTESPVLLGGGARLFENLGGADVQLEQVRAVEAPGVTHVKYRVRSGS